jgi:hypothetical protein
MCQECPRPFTPFELLNMLIPVADRRHFWELAFVCAGFVSIGRITEETQPSMNVNVE